jgi:hypothetical protein
LKLELRVATLPLVKLECVGATKAEQSVVSSSNAAINARIAVISSRNDCGRRKSLSPKIALLKFRELNLTAIVHSCCIALGTIDIVSASDAVPNHHKHIKQQTLDQGSSKST